MNTTAPLCLKLPDTIGVEEVSGEYAISTRFRRCKGSTQEARAESTAAMGLERDYFSMQFLGQYPEGTC